MNDCYHERVFYYWRHGLYGHVRLLCERAQKQKPNDLFLHLWQVLASGVEGRTDMAIEELKKMNYRSDLVLLFCVAQYCVHKCADEPDKKELQRLHVQILKHIDTANSFSLSTSAQVAWMFCETNVLKDIMNGVSEDVAMMPMLGWMKLTDGDYEGANRLFETVLKDPTKSYDLLTLYGKALYLTAVKNHTECIQVYARILSLYDFPEVNIEKARVYGMMGKWNMASEIALDQADHLPTRMEAELMNALAILVRGGDAKKVIASMNVIVFLISEHEAKNWRLSVKLARAFGTLCCDCLPIIDRTLNIAQIAVNANPVESRCLAVLGYHQMMARNYVVAYNTINEAIERNPEDFFAIRNMLKLLIETGRSDEVNDQLELYSYLDDPCLALMESKARIARVDGDFDSQILTLLAALERHIETLDTENGINWKYAKLELQPERVLDLFIVMDIHEIVGALDELIVFNRSIRYAPNGAIGERIEKIFNVIERVIPGHIPVKFARAFYDFSNKRFDDAESGLYSIYLSKWNYRLPDALTLSASILCERGQKEAAQQYLDEALALDQTISRNMSFRLAKLQIDPTKSNIANLLDLFQSTKQSVRDTIRFLDVCISAKDYYTGFILLKLLAGMVAHPSVKSELVARQAMLVAGKGDLKKAMSLLEGLKQHSKYKLLAITTEARIKLEILDDSEGYIQVLKSLVKDDPSPQNLVVLGDAYTKVLCLDRAASVYSQVVDKANVNGAILKKYVSALVGAHRFDTAVTVFKATLTGLRNSVYVHLFLIKELIRIRRYEDAQACIVQTAKLISSSNVVLELDFLEQRGITAYKLHNNEEAEQWLSSALAIYDTILSNELTQSFAQLLRKRASNVCYYLAELKVILRIRDKSIDLHRKALELDEGNTRSLLALVNYHKGRMESEQCVQLCSRYLTFYPHNEAIALLLTSFEVKGYTESIECLERVLKVHPNFYRTLVRLIEICARAGKLTIAGKRITNDQAPGMVFAKGLFCLYTGKWDEAKACFMSVEGDTRWGMAAKHGMFQLLVNPERKYIWSEKGPFSTEFDLSRAERLISKMSLTDDEKAILYADVKSYRNTDASVAQALSGYNAILEAQPTNIPALVGKARCLIRLGQPIEADKFVDKVLQMKPYHETYAYFEEAYLMRAHITLNDHNYRAAQYFILLALDLNMSSKKGWEMAAATHLHNHLYSEAANAFYHCWELTGKTNPETGYQFALCALKASKPENALAMCRHIQESNPSFRDMREQIIMPAFRNLRP